MILNADIFQRACHWPVLELGFRTRNLSVSRHALLIVRFIESARELGDARDWGWENGN